MLMYALKIKLKINGLEKLFIKNSFIPKHITFRFQEIPPPKKPDKTDSIFHDDSMSACSAPKLYPTLSRTHGL